MKCPLCRSDDIIDVYEILDVPTFQNKSYNTMEKAKDADKGNIRLSECLRCGFIFNSLFDPAKMIYDNEYQNEQAHSESFKRHLDNVINIIRSNGFLGKKIVEIGCGKGHFLGMLRDNGFNVIGFDPAYEESDKSIVKDYFGKNYYGLNADLVVLRHTIEHVNRPMDFIQTIAKSCGYKGKILIETPDFRWVVEHSVFWDICYEHCNYFTPDSIGGMFEQYEYANLFGGQYMYILADLSSMRDRAVNTHEILTFDSQKFTSSIEEFRSSVSNKSDLVVWGAGTKGVLLANITDPNREHIEYLVDINPDKQGRYIPGSGHHVVSPEEIKQKNSGEILVLNKNYKGEIEKFLSGTDCRII